MARATAEELGLTTQQYELFQKVSYVVQKSAVRGITVSGSISHTIFIKTLKYYTTLSFFCAICFNFDFACHFQSYCGTFVENTDTVIELVFTVK